MTIIDIKAAVNQTEGTSITHLLMVNQKDEAGLASEWFSHWDNTKRIRVVMHAEVLAAIKANPSKADLVFKRQTVPATATKAAYTRYVVVVPAEVEAVF